MSYFWIGLGSAIGGMLRFFLSGVAARWFGHAFLGTMFVNVTGSFAIGFAAALGPLKMWEQLLMIGVMGGYTTFSSFSLQTLQLIHEGRWLSVCVNVGGSVVLCLAAVWFGHLCGSGLRR
jgi:CrcB protein